MNHTYVHNMHIYDVLSFLFGSRHRPFLRSEVRSKKSEVWAAWRLSHCIHSTILTIIGRYIGVISLDRLSAVNCFNSRTRELCGHNFWSYLCSICSLVWRFQGLSSHISLPTKILNDTPSTMQVSMSFHSGSMDIFCWKLIDTCIVLGVSFRILVGREIWEDKPWKRHTKEQMEQR